MESSFRWPVVVLPVPVSTLASSALALLISSWVVYDQSVDWIMNPELTPAHPSCQVSAFDYIVVGAGAAGMVVATRIANASATSRILLLEAGGEPSPLNDIPALDVLLGRQPANTWKYTSPRNPKCCLNIDEQKTSSPRGKLLGGSTSVNLMMYVRGNKEDFNRWAEEDAGGDEAWNYQNLLPYFKKFEDYNGAYSSDADSTNYHGKGGLVNIAFHEHAPGERDFLAAGLEKGYTIGDYNGANQQVFSSIDVTTQGGRREHTYKAYYTDTGRPSNLCIKKYATVTKVNFKVERSGRGTRAVGVTYQRHGLSSTVKATTEVILSAGVMGSPKLLLLSGVGPADHLQSLGIPVIKDLPVGHNLQDHIYAFAGPFLKSPSNNPRRDFTPQSAVEYLAGNNGIFASPYGLAGQAFFQSPFANPPYPDLQAVQFSIALYPETAADIHAFAGVNVSLMNDWFEPFQRENLDARFAAVVLGRPKSVGRLRLASSNPDDDPIVDPNYFDHPEDQEALLYGFKKMVDLYETTVALNASLFPKPVPGCEDILFKSDEYYRCAIRHYSGSLFHHVGTCALGQVVDTKLKVIGIDGLRVIDASVIPRTPNANTVAAAMMIGEKGADLIVADMNNNKESQSREYYPVCNNSNNMYFFTHISQ